jgi:hypothetical protein
MQSDPKEESKFVKSQELLALLSIRVNIPTREPLQSNIGNKIMATSQKSLKCCDWLDSGFLASSFRLAESSSRC